MSYHRTLLLCVSFVFMSAAAFAQDAIKADPQHYTVILENASVRVLRVSYEAGSKSVTHAHPDAIFISLAPVKARVTTLDGQSQRMQLANVAALYMTAGAHRPSSVGAKPVEGILVEFKTPAPGRAALPTSRPNMTMKALAIGPRAVAYQVSSTAAFAEPPGSTHDFDQVVIALDALPLSLAMEGKPARTTWAYGDVVFVGRGVPHEAKNLRGKSGSTVNVLIK